MPDLWDLATEDYAENPHRWSPDPILSLISRSECDLESLVIKATRPDKQIPRINTSLEPFFRALPYLSKLTVSFIIPPAIFQAIQSKEILQHLENYHGRLRPRGAHALLDLLSTYLEVDHRHRAGVNPGLSIKDAYFTCTPPGRESHDVFYRFISNSEAFEGRAVTIAFLDEDGYYIDWELD